VKTPEPNRSRRSDDRSDDEAVAKNRKADTAPNPAGDNLPSDKPHQEAEEQLNPHYGQLRRPDKARGD
jgi:hypothetical protein